MVNCVLTGRYGACSLLILAWMCLCSNAWGDPPNDPPTSMALVPAGSFVMGSDTQGEMDERPAHRVDLRAFYIDRFEVTVGQYAACVRARACQRPRKLDPRFSEPDRPVVGVSWHDAKAYCAFAGKRLPTEAEWEKAARGAQGRIYPWGDDPPHTRHGCFGWQENRPCRPGSRPDGDSQYGVSDMAGGVWEWVEDVYDAGYYPRSPVDNPTGGTCQESLTFFDKLRREKRRGFTGGNPIPTECERVLRGGAWNYPPRGLRSSNRVHHAPDFRIQVSGIRCAKDAT
jgi:formylglycine-generating enzyme required for sulfatase activity